MKIPSRKMPKIARRDLPLWVLLLPLLSVLAYFCFQYAWVTFFVVLGGIAVYLGNFQRDRRLKLLIQDRKGESICQFARSFPRGTDTWILRAVYEETSYYVSWAELKVPVRANDNLESDLFCDEEDLEDLLCDISFRCGRSLEFSSQNPMSGKVKTVGDLVRLLELQPLGVAKCSR